MAALDDIRKAVADFKDEAIKMRSHLERLINEYSDFEERVYQIHLKIEEAEKEHGLTKEEIYQPPEEEYDIPDI